MRRNDASQQKKSAGNGSWNVIREQSKIKNVYVDCLSAIMSVNDLRRSEDAVVAAIERLIQKLRELE